MEVNNQDLSLLLYDYLCRVVGSEDVVRTRRRIFNAADYVTKSKDMIFISSGSKAEGLDLCGSDFDVIYIFNDMQVYENTDDIIDTPITLRILLMDTNDTKPGYTRLELFKMNHIHSNIDNMYNKYLPHEVFFIADGISVRHGPSRSDPNGLSDHVFALHCKKWISQANQWKQRSRLTWPHNKLIETIVQNGVLFVPVGCKNSPAEEFEFRISFNVAEKILVHSFSHVQLHPLKRKTFPYER